MDAHHDLLTRIEQMAASEHRPAPPAPRAQAQSREDTLQAALATIQQLEVALEHRSVISGAVGMLAERFGMPMDTAFSVLMRISQETNRKIYDLALELTSTGHTEDL